MRKTLLSLNVKPMLNNKTIALKNADFFAISFKRTYMLFSDRLV